MLSLQGYLQATVAYHRRQHPMAMLARCFATMVIARRLATWLHELSHFSIAGLLGYRNMQVELKGRRASVILDTAPSTLHASLIRHSGWIASVAIAATLMRLEGEHYDWLPAEAHLATLGAVLVALEALHSDLLSSERPLGRAPSDARSFASQSSRVGPARRRCVAAGCGLERIRPGRARVTSRVNVSRCRSLAMAALFFVPPLPGASHLFPDRLLRNLPSGGWVSDQTQLGLFLLLAR